MEDERRTHIFAPGQTLLIDADDTLWENNIYFERAIAAFISYLDHKEYTREQVRAKLNEVERENVRRHGYGLTSFRRALVTCFERLTTGPMTPEKHERIMSFAQSIADQEIELLEGVAETLPVLASRHKLILMTKGNEEEQADKLARSGVAQHFSGVEVPREKDPDAYREVCAKYSAAAAHDVDDRQQPAVGYQSGAGVRAACGVHPPSAHLGLEHEALDPAPEGQRLLEVARFGELGRWF